MIRWLERNAYDVSYFTGVDADRLGLSSREHRAFLSVGHDEYWSGQQRPYVEAARGAGVNLAFFSGNEVFWKTRWEDGYRTLVCYKGRTARGRPQRHLDRHLAGWPALNPEGANPENSLTGTSFEVNSGTSAIEVPAADGDLRLWRDTSCGEPEWRSDRDARRRNARLRVGRGHGQRSRPPGLVRLSTTERSRRRSSDGRRQHLQSGPATHHLTLYRHDSGALVFGAGTVQWSWGLDDTHTAGTGAGQPGDAAGDGESLRGHERPPRLASARVVSRGYVDGHHAADLPSRRRSCALRRRATSVGPRPTQAGAASGPSRSRRTTASPGTPRRAGDHGRYRGCRLSPARPLTVLTRAADDSGNLSPAAARRRWRTGGGGGRAEAVGTGGGGTAGGGGTGPAVGGGGRGREPGAGAGAGKPGSGSAADTRAPRVLVKPSRVRASATGRIKLRVACPAGEVRCTVRLRIFRGGDLAGQRKVVIAGGGSRTVTVKLNRATRRKLAARALAADHRGRRGDRRRGQPRDHRNPDQAVAAED